jgi:hypothetical protein
VKELTSVTPHGGAASPGTPSRDDGKAPRKRGRPKGQPVTPRPIGAGASAEAKRLAAAILEVLAGARTPTEAALSLGLSLPRYYLLEDRALQGMLVACEPRTMSRGPSAESALAALRRECDQLRRECTRQQTLVRAAQRTIGLAPPTPATRGPQSNGKKRRPRRPTARALRVAARLKEADQPAVAVTAAVESA